MAARRQERTTTTVTTKRESRATSRIADGAEEAPVVVKQGMGLGDAMGIVSFLLLLAAIVLTDMMLGKQYGTGMFFK